MLTDLKSYLKRVRLDARLLIRRQDSHLETNFELKTVRHAELGNKSPSPYLLQKQDA